MRKLGIVTVRPGRRTAPKPAVEWPVRRRYGGAASLAMLDGTGRWTGRPSTVDGRILPYVQRALRHIRVPRVSREITYTTSPNIRPSIRLLMDGTAVLPAVRRWDGELQRGSIQGRDGTVVRPSVHPTVLDGDLSEFSLLVLGQLEIGPVVGNVRVDVLRDGSVAWGAVSFRLYRKNTFLNDLGPWSEKLLKINEVFGRPRRASESCSSTLIKDELVAPSDLIDGDPFANLCVGASRVCNIRVALAPLPPAQNSGPNLPQLQGALPRVPPNQDFAQPTLVAHKAIRRGNVGTALPHTPRYLDNRLISSSGDEHLRLPVPHVDSHSPTEFLSDGLNSVGDPQVPRFRESFLCDDVLFVPSALLSSQVVNDFPYYTFCMNEESADEISDIDVHADTDLQS
ncbi:hypothetical protein B0H14DRAFT_3153188 [Mycena olivaceomarginata]|nr:hypothetical protein B0H14DRAFT_3153188 [Mycena olivaceomarginata]